MTKPKYRSHYLAASCLIVIVKASDAFIPFQSTCWNSPSSVHFGSFDDNQTEDNDVSCYSDTDAASKGLVSTLTNIFNAATITAPGEADTSTSTRISRESKAAAAPKNVEELQSRIRDDYVVNNYLWTGKLDLDCFQEGCRFTDPTLTFEGTDTFQQNTDSLVPIVERFVENCQSVLLDIRSTDQYVETRWNMVGELNGLFWKPKIDVIGRTKFWFDPSDNFRVFFYDESWEIPAYQALLQLVTPAGTFPNSSAAKGGTTTQ